MYASISSQAGKKISYRERIKKIRSVMSVRKGHPLEIVTVRVGLVKVLTNGCTFSRTLAPPGGKGCWSVQSDPDYGPRFSNTTIVL